MLKISTQDNGATVVFDLEGKLAGPWVEELKRCWQRAVVDNRRVVVVLKVVTFIDAQGRNLLTEMHRQGAGIVAQGCMTKAIVEEITRRGDT